LHRIKALVLARAPYNAFPNSQAGGPHRIDAEELGALLQETGFTPRSIELRTSVTFQPDADAAIRFSEASSFGNFLGHLPEPLRQQAREEIHREIEALAEPQGIRQEGARIYAIAVKD
jgi:arsenite methyltransferase